MEKGFDYIIIGAGSAGCVLANRLTENKNNSVLLLEAGGSDKDQNVQVPAGFQKLFKSEKDFNYYSSPQKHMHNREMFLPRGKMLGGCSSINAMIYIRGNRQDYKEWSELGNEGWSYEEVLPYFKKSENQEIFENEYHGKGGPLNITRRNYTNLLSEVFVEAGQELGYEANEDFNGEQQEGFGQYQVNNINGERCSSARAFLYPAAHRSNLTIRLYAEVEKIVVENGSATAVRYRQGRQTHEAPVAKEVILCAGAYNSPKLLMLSGIGNGNDLKGHGIEVVKHIPGVGKNLQDHLISASVFHSSYQQSLDSAENSPQIFKNLFKYLLFKEGPFASNVAEAGAFLKSSNRQPAPDIQIHFAPAYFIGHGFENPEQGNGYSIGSKVLNPSSKGSVKLASANPSAPPIIDHNYLSTKGDVNRAIWGFKVIQQLGTAHAFAPYRKGMYMPDQVLTDEQAIEDHIRATSETLYHPTSTCKMGHDRMAVVDDQLRVHGVEKLRVVDASIMPKITRGNTNAPTIMIAEKAADLILAS